MPLKVTLAGQPPLLSVPEVLAILVERDIPPVVDAPAGQPGRSVVDIGALERERKWAWNIRRVMDKGVLLRRDVHGCDDFSLDAEMAYLAVADVAVWLAGRGFHVELDGQRVMPTPSTPAKVAKIKRKALVAKHESQWATILRDLHKGGTNGLMKAAALGAGYYDEHAALNWARERRKLLPKSGFPRDFGTPGKGNRIM